MPRTSVSLPEALRKRMDAVTEPVNWSQVAAQAFEAKLAEIAARKQVKTMTDVVERLRASRRGAQGQDYQQGLGTGQRWAKTTATWRQLENLREFLGSTSAWGGEPYAPDGWDDLILKVADPVEYEGEHERAAFWETWGDGKSGSFDYVRGFAEGAEEVFLEVASKL